METLTIFGKPDCADFIRSKALLDGFEVPYAFHDVLTDPDAAAEALRVSGGASSPVIVFPDGSFQVEPSNADLAAKLGRTAPAEPDALDGEACAV